MGCLELGYMKRWGEECVVCYDQLPLHVCETTENANLRKKGIMSKTHPRTQKMGHASFFEESSLHTSHDITSIRSTNPHTCTKRSVRYGRMALTAETFPTHLTAIPNITAI